MGLDFLNQYVVLVIVGICICVGYVLKNSFSKLNNKHIPLIMAVLGVGLNIWMTNTLTPEVLLSGMFSGLASTGLHQIFKNMINRKNNDEK